MADLFFGGFRRLQRHEKDGRIGEREREREREREETFRQVYSGSPVLSVFPQPSPPKGGTHEENKVSVSVDGVSNPLSSYVKNKSFLKR